MYADLDILRARAGRLAPAWDADTDPDDVDLVRFLQETSSLLDLELASRGLSVPVADANAVRVLAGISADGALAMALEATWPSDAPADVGKMLDGASARFEAALEAIRNGTHALVTYLSSTSGDGGPGATSFWIEEPDYPLVGSVAYAEYTANPLAAPAAYRGQRY